MQEHEACGGIWRPDPETRGNYRCDRCQHSGWKPKMGKLAGKVLAHKENRPRESAVTAQPRARDEQGRLPDADEQVDPRRK